jgi:4-alpha-glucanotransferase
MNCPSTVFGNWEWRVTEDQLQHSISRHLAEMCALYGR